MIIEYIKLDQFRNFKSLTIFEFDKINLIKGPIGSGKSTLGRIAICFAIYGEYEDTLAKLPTRGEKNCYVEISIKDKEDTIMICREIPNKVFLSLNGVEILQGALNSEKDKWIKERFRDYNYFKKFRMIDITQGLNILEEGSTSLRKTLVSFHESMLNNIRTRLMQKKNQYDKFNKDTAVLYKHFPSDKRMKVLQEADKYFKNSKADFVMQLGELNNDLNTLNSDFGFFNNKYQSLRKNIEVLSRVKPPCPTCNQNIDEPLRIELLEKASKEFKDTGERARELEKYIEDQKEAIIHVATQRTEITERHTKITNLITKLLGRLKQKDYIYTTKDVLNVTNAIKELDRFYSLYILESVRALEPIINNIINKLGFNLTFVCDAKGNFDLSLQRDGYDGLFSYKDLSSGQRLILRIAFQIALLIDKGDSGVIIADEGFNNLGYDDVKNVYELFSELPFQLISILHRFDEKVEGVNTICLK